MKLQFPFIQLPLQFDAGRLAAEVQELGDAAWREHPLKYPGNFAVPLIAVDGDPHNDGVSGAMRPTPYLEHCPYLVEVLARLGAVWGHTRLMKLSGNAEVTPHVDINYYWRERMRVHVPILTQPGVRFICGDAEVNMGPGECWLFDTWRLHRVVNVTGHERIHLVADTVGGDNFWDIAAAGRVPGQPAAANWRPERFEGSNADAMTRLMFERVNVPVVMSPWELREHMQFLLASVRQPDPQFPALQQANARFVTSWHALWARFGESREGWPLYRTLLGGIEGWMERNAPMLQLTNGMGFVRVWRSMVLKAALADHGPAGEEADTRDAPQANARVQTPSTSWRGTMRGAFDRPVFIVSPPRSGSTMLFETLSQSPDVYTIGGESHRIIEVEIADGALGTIERGYESNRLDAMDATPEIADELKARYQAAVFDRDGKRPAGPIRLLEKTPKNALRVPFLARLFPDARFVYLYRDPREVLASMLEAWESGRFVTYPELPGWSGMPWSMVLVPGWRNLIGKPLPEIVAVQWQVTTRLLLGDLELLPQQQRVAVNYGDFVSDPEATIGRLCADLGLRWDRSLAAPLPSARYTVSAPRPGKWRMREREIGSLLDMLTETTTWAERVARRDAVAEDR